MRDVLLLFAVVAFWFITALLVYRNYWVWKAIRVIAILEAGHAIWEAFNDADKYRQHGDYDTRIGRYWSRWRMFWSLWVWDIEKLKARNQSIGTRE